MIGNNVAHSKLRTKRVFDLNLKTKKFWSEEEQRFITLKVTCKGMRTIEKKHDRWKTVCEFLPLSSECRFRQL